MKKFLVLSVLIFIYGCSFAREDYYGNALNNEEMFVDEYAVVVLDNKYGLVDKNNKFIVSPKYSCAQNIPGRFFFVCKDSEGNKCAYMSKANNKLLTGYKYVGCGNGDISEGFHEGMAKVVVDNDGKWLTGYIDKKGNEVIRPQYKYGGAFSEGLANVLFENGKYGYIDKVGKLVIPAQYYYAEPFKNGTAQVRLQKGVGMNCCVINKLGKVIYKDAIEGTQKSIK